MTGSGSTGGAGSGSTSGGTSDRPVTVRQSYAAFCEGSTVQWGFFTYRRHDAGRLQHRHADAHGANGGWARRAPVSSNLLTASTALGTSRCTITGPAPCPIDLFEVLGGAPLVHHPLSELEVVFSPSSSDQRMPTVDDWQLDYSCTFNQ